MRTSSTTTSSTTTSSTPTSSATARPLSVDLESVRPLVLGQIEQFVDAAAALDDLALLEPSRCRGWSRLDVVVHVRAGVEELAATAGATTDRVPDHDAATYWRSRPDDRDDDPVPHIMWLRRTAAAYGRPSSAVTHLRAVADIAKLVVGQAADRSVIFQGKAMTVGDVLATWVVEIAVHLLDLDVGAQPIGAALARRTLEALASADLPSGLDDTAAVLAGLGRTAWPGVSGRFPVSL